MAAVLDVIRYSLQQSVVRNIERRHNEQLVRGEIRCSGKYEIRSQVQFVERAVDLPNQRSVVSRRSGIAPFRARRGKGHKTNTVERVAAVEDRHLVVNLQAHEMRADFFQFMRRATHLGVYPIRFEVVR